MGPFCIDNQEIENVVQSPPIAVQEEYNSDHGKCFVHVTRLFAAIGPIFKLICGV